MHWTHEVRVNSTLVQPAWPLYVLEVWINGKLVPELEHRWHKVVALRNSQVHHYEAVTSSDRKPATAPHHSELTKAGWVYKFSTDETEALIVNDEFHSITASSELDCSNVATVVTETQLQGDALKELITTTGKWLGTKQRIEQSTEPKTESKLDATGYPTQESTIADLRDMRVSKVELGRAMFRLISYDPYRTISQIAELINQSVSWVQRQSGLDKLGHAAWELVHDGKINMANAWALARLPEAEQSRWVEKARSTAPPEFVPMISCRVKEIRDAKRESRLETPKGRKP